MCSVLMHHDRQNHMVRPKICVGHDAHFCLQLELHRQLSQIEIVRTEIAAVRTPSFLDACSIRDQVCNLFDL